ncbi:hypothetical protein MRB53_009566 [Persea americana]|uniref:Uncharacterized protein n=1 Tax=Persea americana TaxID=3435 RepID=A0ACC2LPD7_PERAE|nr:hypothetical protein MRB53_009566 [Persea americana]|eukprot:TRINITY_DN12281_c0_g6_i1.p1 TRINITY_DN12281_c0_g6~~TRINITY_DN12281_c0_g6_i1.p1  ORF type:complete len:217 (-),score=54.49 TRINITY_DN12281_c0_g6_i1:282-932(-)
MAVGLGLSVSPSSLILFNSSAHGLSSSSVGVRNKSNPFRPSLLLDRFPSGVTCQRSCLITSFSRKVTTGISPRNGFSKIPRSTGSSSTESSQDDSKASDETKVPFGYTRKDVLLIGIGVTVIGFGLKNGLEFVGVDPLKAGNVVQLVLVLGLTVGWISTYIFRVSNKDMTYVQQLRDYENKVMEKRLEGLTEAELEALLQQVEEEKQRPSSREQLP